MREAEMHLDVDAELAELALEYGYLAELGAEMTAEEIRDSISISDVPAGPGQPPHSMGPYRDAWKHGKAKRRRDRVTAYAFNMASTSSGASLAAILDEGLGPIHPHPHVRGGIHRARHRLDTHVDQLNNRLRGGL